MNFKPLTSLEEIFEAKQLLFRSYIEQQKWKPGILNPSGLKVYSAKGKSYLTDDLDSRATWFGVYSSQGELIACARIIRSLNSKLEYNLYTEIPQGFTGDINSCVEMNRVAVLPGHENSQALAILVKHLIEFCTNMKINFIFTTVSFPNPGAFLEKLGWHKWPDTTFSYDTKDPRPVEILSLDLNDKLRIEKLHNIFDNLMAA